MKVSTKELRIQPGRIIDMVAHGEEVTVTYRGKALAKIVPLTNTAASQEKEEPSIFGLWKEHEQRETVEDHVRELRKGRHF
jgi:prevent-host-death family protein